MLKDIDGKPIRKGSKVRRAAYGSDVLPESRRRHSGVRTVEEIGASDILAGYIKVTGVLGWERPGQFERV